MKNNSFYTSSSRSMHFGGDEYGEYDVTTEYDAPGTTFPRNRIGYDYGHDDSSGMANDDNDDDNDGEDNSSSSLMQQYRGQDTDEMTTETALSALRKQAEARKKRQQVDITSSNGQRQHAVGDLYASAVQMVRGADLTARPGYTPHRMTDSSLLREPLLDGHGHYTAEQSIVSSSDGEISFGRDDVVLSELYKKGEETVQRAIVSDESRMKGVENIIRYLQEREEEYHALHEIGKEELFNQKGVNEEVIFPEKVECGLLDDDELIMIDEDKKSKQGKMVKIANQTFEKIEESDVITVLSDEDGDKSVLYKDDYGDMTRGRKIAIWLSGYKWYNPNQSSDPIDTETGLGGVEDNTGNNGNMSLKLVQGWEYFEHNSLARHITKGKKEVDGIDDGNNDDDSDLDLNDDSLEKADPGEKKKPTKLYDVWGTPSKQLGDFGLAIGVYFDTVIWLAGITLAAGLINLPNVLHYYSHDYDESDEHSQMRILLRGSAICTETFWAPCPDCTINHWNYGAEHRFATGINEETGESLIFALRNACHGAVYSNFGCVLFLFIALHVMCVFQEDLEVKFDEDIQSGSDYAIAIDNPPPEANDPDVWKDFFENIVGEGQVRFVTIAVDNHKYLSGLEQRRMYIRRIRQIFHDPRLKRIDFERKVGEAPKSSLWQRLTGNCPHTVYKQYLDSYETIKELSKAKCYVTDVFVIFETEKAQRKVLRLLSVGRYHLMQNEKKNFPIEYMFPDGDDSLILDITEPSEPSAIRWKDIAASDFTRRSRILVSTLLSLTFIYAGATWIMFQRSQGGSVVALWIAVLNVITPNVCTFIVGFEQHPDEGDKSLSLYTKITIFRWVNTAIVLSLATPFADTLGGEDGDLIPSIYNVFFAELVTVPLTALTDLGGHFSRHYTAPRAVNREEVNACFQGADYELAERYTTVTKLLFLCFFFATLYPMGFFICSLALYVAYFTDKFCLLRVWKPAPQMGNEIAEFSRNYLYTFMLVLLVLVSAYQFAGFPYDNLCEAEGALPADYTGHFTIYTENKTDDPAHAMNVSVKSNDTMYYYCDMDKMYEFSRTSFPPNAELQGDDHWMTETQEGIVTLIGQYGFGVLLIGAVFKCIFIIYGFFRGCFKSSYEPVGRVQGKDFSKEDSVSAYVPQIRNPNFNYPLIACDITDIPSNYIGWTGQKEDDHQFFNLMRNIPEDIKNSEDGQDMMSIVKYYPPRERESDDDPANQSFSGKICKAMQDGDEDYASAVRLHARASSRLKRYKSNQSTTSTLTPTTNLGNPQRRTRSSSDTEKTPLI